MWSAMPEALLRLFGPTPHTSRARTAAVAVVLLLIAAIAIPTILIGSSLDTEVLPPATPTRSSAQGPLSSEYSLTAPTAITVPADAGWVSWALADVDTGQVVASSDNAGETTTTESMIKAWIAADYLHSHPTVTERRLDQIRTMIIDSDDDAAQDIYGSGGYDLVIDRMIKTCGLHNITIHHHWWSLTEIDATAAAHLGVCIADGTAAGPAWTPWLLQTMHDISGEGRFGIVDALPDVDVVYKNGWTPHGDEWHVNCLAIVDGRWSVAILTRYPRTYGLQHGAALCASITHQLDNRCPVDPSTTPMHGCYPRTAVTTPAPGAPA